MTANAGEDSEASKVALSESIRSLKRKAWEESRHEIRQHKDWSATNGIQSRLIIHGGAGSISRANLPPSLYQAHRKSMLHILRSTADLLASPTTTALDAAIHAVSLLELHPLYNAGRGAVFTAAGRIEHEASVMLSTPHPLVPDATGEKVVQGDFRKRACSTMRTSTVKHPIRLAGEMLRRGARDAEQGTGARGHVQLCDEAAKGLAREWGLEVKRPSWFWERKRWEQHRRGLGLGTSDDEWKQERRRVDEEAGWEGDGYDDEGERADLSGVEGVQRMRDGTRGAVDGCGFVEEADAGWDGVEYIPQGTVGAVVLDRFGTICVATSTGGLTNKLPGRIGDTPTIGAGFWAESWTEDDHVTFGQNTRISPLERLCQGDWMGFLESWLPRWILPQLAAPILPPDEKNPPRKKAVRAVAMSGTGNGDSFLKLCAARTVAALVRFSSPSFSLEAAIKKIAGPAGQLQESAEDRWLKSGEGEGGIIGIELHHGVGKVVADFNCGGMFRAWIDDAGKEHMMVFRDDYSRSL